jgi:hypothetical protein
MNDQFNTKHVLIQELASLKQRIEELEQSESEWNKEMECQIIKPVLLVDFMLESNELKPIFVSSIKSAKR